MIVQGASISVPSVLMMDAGAAKDAEIDAAGRGYVALMQLLL